MNYQKQLKWIIMCVVFLLGIAVNFTYVYSPKQSEATEMQERANQDKQKIESMDLSKKLEASNFEKNKKKNLYEFNEVNNKLPNYLVPEEFVPQLSKLADDNNIELSGLSFTDPKEYATQEVTQVYNGLGKNDKADQTVDETIAGFFLNNDNKKPASEDELQLSKVQDDKPISINLNFRASAQNYQDLVNFIDKLQNEENLTTINSLGINASDKDISASLTITIYGYRNSKLPVYSKWDSLNEKGKSDLFNSGKGGVIDINNRNNSDFDINLNPITYAAPSIIIMKHNDYTTSIFGSEKQGVEKAEMYIIERAGKFYYKYKTESAQYPATYVETEFNPVDSKSGKILINVFSKPRLDSSDTSGVELTIYNKTKTRTIDPVVFNDDPINPRMKIEVR